MIASVPGVRSTFAADVGTADLPEQVGYSRENGQ
jgi:hypothetical protein